MVCHPAGEGRDTLDIKDLVDEVGQRGIALPRLIRLSSRSTNRGCPRTPPLVPGLPALNSCRRQMMPERQRLETLGSVHPQGLGAWTVGGWALQRRSASADGSPHEDRWAPCVRRGPGGAPARGCCRRTSSTRSTGRGEDGPRQAKPRYLAAIVADGAPPRRPVRTALGSSRPSRSRPSPLQRTSPPCTGCLMSPPSLRQSRWYRRVIGRSIPAAGVSSAPWGET